MAPQNYTRLDTDFGSSGTDYPVHHTRSGRRGRRKAFLTGLAVVALVWLGYSVTSIRTEVPPYNPIPTGGDDVYNSSSLPVVLWHGMGDSCCATWSIGALQKQIEQSLPGDARSSSCRLHSSLTCAQPTKSI